MLNYHELTMNEPRNSPARRKQFLVISLIMTGMTLHSGLNAGVLAPLDIEREDLEGAPHRFPGGEFVYKLMTKDYAATTGTLRTVAADLDIAEEGSGDLLSYRAGQGLVEMDTSDLLYLVLMDDAALVPGGRTRYAAGALLGKGIDGGGDMKRRLLDANENIKEGRDPDGGSVHSRNVRYEVGRLPSVEAAVAQHPFTAGAWSAVLQTYKIIPKFKRYAREKGDGGDLVMVATCSASQRMCTYYLPLSKRDKFYMGRPTTERYAGEFGDLGALEKMGVDFGEDGPSMFGINFRKVFRGVRRLAGGGSKEKGGVSDGEL